ncbi:hypothetical protein BJ170DRAFT_694611 [Xylariales sp. AK1849]|nr:hypothetical protein BJ170DRAFT_694611 [Xylariales sp. AK1849]
MKLVFAALSTSSLVACVLAAAQYGVYPQTSCQDQPLGIGNIGNGCHSLAGDGQINKAIKFIHIKKGCSVHVYTDTKCSKDQTAASDNQCLKKEGGWLSYKQTC